jgi:hypothetical protein
LIIFNEALSIETGTAEGPACDRLAHQHRPSNVGLQSMNLKAGANMDRYAHRAAVPLLMVLSLTVAGGGGAQATAPERGATDARAAAFKKYSTSGGYARFDHLGRSRYGVGVCDTKADGRGIHAQLRNYGGKIWGEVKVTAGKGQCTARTWSLPKNTKLSLKVCTYRKGTPMGSCETYHPRTG